MEKNSNDEELMALIFDTTTEANNKEETVLDLIDESLAINELKESDISQTISIDDSFWSKHNLLSIVEEF